VEQKQLKRSRQVKELMDILIKPLCCAALCAVLSGCAAIGPAVKIIAQKTAAYLCSKTVCKNDGKVTP
jgi:hypothetical protein